MNIVPSIGLLVIGLAGGMLLGRLSFSPKQSTADDSESTSARTRSTRRDRSSGPGSDLAGIAKIRKSSPAELGDLTRMAASMNDPVESQRLVSECLLHMTADNWFDVVSGFGKLSKSTGRDPAEKWKLALVRSGQVAGEQAMDYYLQQGLGKKKQETWSVLYGWSTKDPRAALAWLGKAEAAGHSITAENYSAIISGAALTNPQDALVLLAGIPADRRSSSAGNLVWNVVQNGGSEALDPLLQFASSLDKSDASNVEFANDLFDEITGNLLWKADQALDVAQACDVVLKLTQFGRDPTATTVQALNKYRWYKMSDKLDLIETVSAAPQHSGLNFPALTTTIVRTMSGDGDRQAVREWMVQHPDSPLIPHLKEKIPD